MGSGAGAAATVAAGGNPAVGLGGFGGLGGPPGLGGLVTGFATGAGLPPNGGFGGALAAAFGKDLTYENDFVKF